jgi:hypothetical protein
MSLQKKRKSVSKNTWSTLGVDGQRKYLTQTEADRFFTVSEMETISVHTFCWFITSTGCRISEALMISARSIDFEAGVAVIECLKKRRSGVFRAVPLPATLLEALKSHLQKGDIQGSDRLWPWSRMTGYRRITEVMRKAGIAGPWATPKGLRHAFGVRAVQSGAPLHMVQRWLGHADMKTTAIYAGAVGPEERELAARTWIKSDRGPARPGALPSQPLVDESDLPSAPLLYACDAAPVSPYGAQSARPTRPSWLKRLFLDKNPITACQLIQFCLLCNKFSVDIS